ncbi:thioredoxin fold domain-containing protein [Pseudomonas sp. 5P_3.1_Bac2]|uniref:thioredoxin fold domain-containing protein n=1 Tax=Pseudomonas sp. 5P_3.1_Bac2 TaxID=2971617 RepID=UPI0021C68B44|nr:thioredoxin fold domain-containing protein [Pseudomonas sp. 5P_3.1_Bac2]MCU1719616.1 thioredoxin fold domain-containing protein [Pseudomonas sp. 5P_3.1_Bac2]
MGFKRIVMTLAIGLASHSVFAADAGDAIRSTLKALDPEMTIEAIAEAPMPGVYQIELTGGRQLYSSADGKFLLQGNLYQIKDGKAVNLTEGAEMRGVAKLINAIPASEMVVFAGDKPKTHITVFTDTDCGYCQKLHSEVSELNKLGVEVRYVAFPRQGLNSPAAKELANVWCAKDRQAAMTRAKTQKGVPDATCDNPVAKQYNLGLSLGVSGTPAIILANGKMIPGYQPAPILAKVALEAN